MIDPNWPFDAKWTDAELALMRHDAIRLEADIGNVIEKFTCDECSVRHECSLVFDGYNTDGDCLAMK